MSQLIIDLNESPARLQQFGKLLFELSGVSQPVETVNDGMIDLPTHVSTGEVAAAPAPADTVTVMTTDAPAPLGEVDASGRPWDERIHAGTKTKTAGGMWKKRKGVDATLYEQVMAEIAPAPVTKQPLFTPAEIAESEQLTTATAGSPDDQAAKAAFGMPQQQAPAQGQAVPQQQAPVQQQAVTPDADAGEMTWPMFMQRFVAKHKSGTLDVVRQNELLSLNGLQGMPLLINRPDLWPTFIEELAL